jgi:hypothetical protein
MPSSSIRNPSKPNSSNISFKATDFWPVFKRPVTIDLCSKRKNQLASSVTHVAVIENSHGSAVKVFILTCAQGPEEGDEADSTKSKCCRNQEQQDVHAGSSRVDGARRTEPSDRGSAVRSRERCVPPALKAFSVTSIDDPDMASAAISGVT